MKLMIQSLSGEDRTVTCQKRFCVNCSEFRVLREISSNYKEVTWMCRSCTIQETKDLLKSSIGEFAEKVRKTPTCELTIN